MSTRHTRTPFSEFFEAGGRGTVGGRRHGLIFRVGKNLKDALEFVVTQVDRSHKYIMGLRTRNVKENRKLRNCSFLLLSIMGCAVTLH